MNNFPENQDLLKRSIIIPGNKSYVTAVSEHKVNKTYEERNYPRPPQKKTIFIIDIHLTRIKKIVSEKKSKEISCILNVLMEQIPNSWIIM